MFKFAVVLVALSALVGCAGAPGPTYNIIEMDAPDSGETQAQPDSSSAQPDAGAQPGDAGADAAVDPAVAACITEACLPTQEGTQCGVLPPDKTCGGQLVYCGDCSNTTMPMACGDTQSGSTNICGDTCRADSHSDAYAYCQAHDPSKTTYTTTLKCNGAMWVPDPTTGKPLYRPGGRTGCDVLTDPDTSAVYTCCAG